MFEKYKGKSKDELSRDLELVQKEYFELSELTDNIRKRMNKRSFLWLLIPLFGVIIYNKKTKASQDIVINKEYFDLKQKLMMYELECMFIAKELGIKDAFSTRKEWDKARKAWRKNKKEQK